MKILVVGASQGTGAATVENALARGHEVTAFSRSPEKLTIQSPKLSRSAGSFFDRKAVDDAVRGHDAVIITASATSMKAFKENPNYFSEGTGVVIDAMKHRGVKKLSVLSAFGVGPTRAHIGWFARFVMVDGLLKLPFADHERQETLVQNSGLDWVIAQPTRLNSGSAKNAFVKVTAGFDKVPSSISRADVASFLVSAVELDTWNRQLVALGG